MTIDLLGALGAVLRATALAAFDAEGVEGAADDVIADARKIADAAAADQHDAVLLQVVLFAGDVGGDFLAVGEPDAGDLAEGRVGLLGGHGLDLEAHAALLRACDKVFDLVDLRQGSARLLDELIDRRHLVPFPVLSVKTVSPWLWGSPVV